MFTRFMNTRLAFAGPAVRHGLPIMHTTSGPQSHSALCVLTRGFAKIRKRATTAEQTTALQKVAAVERKKSTKMAEQYMGIKKSYPDCMLLFQVGDFYELYNEDAELVSRELKLKLTEKVQEKLKKVAGFPVHAFEEWKKDLLKCSKPRFALCVQTGEKTEQALMEREVVRIFTPGTVETDSDAGNYLTAIHLFEPAETIISAFRSDRDHVGGPLRATQVSVANYDVGTNHFEVTTTALASLEEVLSRFNTAEIILTKDTLRALQTVLADSRIHEAYISSVADDYFELSKRSSGSVTLKGGDVKNGLTEGEKKAAGAVAKYIAYTHMDKAYALPPVDRFLTEEFMQMDLTARLSLGLTSEIGRQRCHTLLGYMDRCSTAAGRRLLRSMIQSPSVDLSVITQRQSAVGYMVDNQNYRKDISTRLTHCDDISRLVPLLQRLDATPRNVLDIYRTLLAAKDMHTDLHDTGTIGDQSFEALKKETTGLDNGMAAMKTIAEWMVDEGDGEEIKWNSKNRTNQAIVKTAKDIDGAWKQIESLCFYYKNLMSHSSSVINKGVRLKDVGGDLGWVLEVNRKIEDAFMKSTKDHVMVERKNSCTQFTTETLRSAVHHYQSLCHKLKEQERKRELKICKDVGKHSEEILAAGAALARLDVVSSLATLAVEENLCRPTMTDGVDFNIENGYHPVVQMNSPYHRFTPNSCNLNEQRVWVLNGPNMGGKSTFLRQNALIAVMAQIGSYVPATKATIGIVDRLYVRVGAHDDVTRRSSTFRIEMLETAHIVTQATEKSLVLMDEIGRGTAVYDGMALAAGVFIHCAEKKKSRTLAATHFNDISEYLRSPEIGFKMMDASHDNNGRLVYAYRVVPGIAKNSYGIEVAKAAGVPREITDHAESLLEKISNRNRKKG
eukprot:comp23398_c1_seq1/m.38806 comp23398_c1_seq1/g.38806  ORF comp23398_c1_seq1/g.38806 comp23398_c1_seq1/m.38806 type:complete len:900 (-) comp23398_c1_seq1:113-2812(-)